MPRPRLRSAHKSALISGLRTSFFDPAREGASLNARGGRDPRDLRYSPRLSAGAELGCQPDFLEHLDAVAPEVSSSLAQGDFADAFLDIGSDRCIADEVAVDEEIEALEFLSTGGWFDEHLVAGKLFVSGGREVAEGDFGQSGFHLGGAGVQGTAVVCAFHKLSLCDDASAFHFEGLDGDSRIAAAADDVFRHAVG